MGETDFKNRLEKHRKLIEFLNQVLHDLYDTIRAIQSQPEMIDTDGSRYGYVTTSINILWEEDKSLRSLYATIQEYSQIGNKDFNTIAIHIAEYRAVNKLASRIKTVNFIAWCLFIISGQNTLANIVNNPFFYEL